ncbi:High-affinity gluconate transporter GntT [Paramagnetospirillum magnetotacticum MS-1]|uniref:High-affinity gluconate transporter GntT n=1 Tax=Paramagnetospirillum magnetotacticum MS-1 TaxID=272627 RepID=A0A0C2YZB7_PARME|nr:hypothetical protein [Paramagnetospirillum magnetotacticum]KIM00429.1 High-affinity gluconate transporter GntT [Paramagnetospirillum magnetotacticum MS-1]
MTSSTAGNPSQAAPRWSGLNLPQPVWLVLLALVIGLASGLNGVEVVRAFSSGFGRILGDFALILLPSFVLAACMARQQLNGADRIAATISPITAAGMVCPDTAYATLASVAERRKLSVAFGSQAGYRLLFPAGPLIVATGLGVNSSSLFVVGLLLIGPVWLAGEVWARYRTAKPLEADGMVGGGLSWSSICPLAPLAVLGGLLLVGSVGDFSALPVVGFLTRPKGALIIAAAVALMETRPEGRRECLDAAMRRTAGLLLVIGAASAFGSMLSNALPLKQMLQPMIASIGVLLVLFIATMIFKLVYGAATATFATVTPILAPLVVGSGISPEAAVFAICLGSFAILPTDSFYWLVRSDALVKDAESSALATMVGGAALQAATGLAVLYALGAVGLV